MNPIGYDRKKAADVLKKHKLDVVVASTGVSVFYTTGLPTLHVAGNPILWVLRNQFPFLSLVRADGAVDLIHWMLFSSLDKFSWVPSSNTHGILSTPQALQQVVELLESWGTTRKTIGLESQMPRYQSEYLRSRLPSATFVDATAALLEMRLQKSEEEIRRIKRSTEISERAIQACIETVRDGVTDNELLQTARRAIVDAGAEGWDHLTLGIGASDPEAPGVGTVMQHGDLARFDFGAVWKGYVSDLSRHAALGSTPKGAEEAVERAIKVQDFCVDHIRPGVNPRTILRQAQDFHKTLAKFGRVYPTCHSLGLEVEEVHLFSALHSVDFPFMEHMVCDIEVWQNVEGCGLVGIEDCYRVTAKGCERLSSLDKHIFVK
jgi:Xaa-Pro aminopeptidase